ncbi:hypothetical protein BDV38DRAFT_237618 [Aspergillus pseudotamarii]|uniref:Uncharacterized protein n=1 Tax=Aspergillus pseudotamarii TaxID=132259 RepID=A0A5N6T4R4_ASPPS|nr:uncharacterized protein BDV38DRAFT_237618 [Aspergillus pseudotamarii]KAE8141239.1 hypothetical protein BDV38DRAFT_237618 [Aspergillus pseudotamarii]
MALSAKRSRFFYPGRPSLSQSESSTAQPEDASSSPVLTSISPTTSLQAPKQSSSATEQAAELLKITKHIRTQLQEAQRLRQLKASLLDPAEKTWINSTISDITDAAHDIAVLLEPIRIELEIGNGRLSLRTQLRWKYRDGQRTINKTQRLLACHRSLIGVLSYLRQVDLSLSTSERTYELDAGVSSSVSLEVSELEVIPTEPVQGKILAPSGNRLEYRVHRPIEEMVMVSGATKLESVVSKATEKRTLAPGTVDCEIDDLLAWRRSRGSIAESKRSVVHIARQFDGDV